jgi:hypothetical protein
VSQSALSQTIRGLEARLGIRLLNRTTRSVSPTPAGERLLQTVRPRIEEIGVALAAASELRQKPAGLIRLTATENAAEAVLWPAIRKLLPEYPDIKVEVMIDYGLTDIVTEQVDAGVRFGETVAKDMIAVRIGPPMRMVVVASPEYLARHPSPRTPRDLTSHECINLPSGKAWDLCLGVRAQRARTQRPGRWPASVQHRLVDAEGCTRRFRRRLFHRAAGQRASRPRHLGPGSGGLVSAVCGLSPLLSEPPRVFGGLRPAC